jgi:hypothetical protein
MIKSLKAALVAASIAVSSAAVAQWPQFPTPNVPKKRDGTPDLNAKTPRAADGHPDLSGIWEIYANSIVVVQPGQQNPSASQQSNKDNAGGGDQIGLRGTQPKDEPGAPPHATFFDIGANIPGGAPYQPWAKELRAKRIADNQKDNPDAHCLPMGYMQLHGHPQPRKIVQTPDLIVIMYEGNSGLRQIFTDGRKLPKVDDDLQPWWYGYSVGHWEGDTLVVESTGFRDDGWLDVYGSPLTDKGKLIEKFRRRDFGHMDIDITVDDPKAYTKPFTVRVSQQILLDNELIEFVCGENEKSSQHYDQ